MSENISGLEPSPLYPLLNEIMTAVNSGAPFLAIVMSVALPDMCVSLVSADGRTSGKAYKEWCKANLGQEFSFLTPDDIYSMRCGVLHNGRFGDLQHNVSRVIFTLPGQGTFINCSLNDAYFYSAKEFCENFVRAVVKWFEAHRENKILKQNLDRFMQYRIGGLSPYISGVTVLA